MEAKAVIRQVRIAPRKTRLVIDLIRGKKIADALAILRNQSQRAARIIEKGLVSAIANAENTKGLQTEKLYVKECFVDEGPVMKRIKFDSRGHTGRNDHRTSHITITLAEKN